MTDIKKVAVLGSGVMGSGIAAHVANAGLQVVLLDIVKDPKDKNALTEKAVEKQLEGKPSGFIHKSRAKLVTPSNLDDLKGIEDCDWIIEAVLEKLEVKQDVYKKIDAKRKKGSIVSSNTSTLPIHELVKGMSPDFAKDFMITHFFNPPRFMRLLEVVKGKDTRPDAFAAISKFADISLGKGIVECKDTPGFIANRIGVYWMMLGVLEAMRMGVTVEQADAVMGKPAGIPKTGVFGLIDLVGIDLMPLIAKELLHTLPKEDPFVTLYQLPPLVEKMIADGYTGRKGKGGFYRINKQGDKKIKEVIDLKTGEYKAQGKKVDLASVETAKGGLRALFEHKDIGGQYAASVLLGTIHYAASLIPEIADDITAVDGAMKMGYNWKYGPFEMIDRLSTKDQNGVDWLIEKFKADGKTVPAILEKAKGKKLYDVQGGKRQSFNIGGAYKPIIPPEGSLMLADIKLNAKPVQKNGSASLWDLGDGIACLELTSKMNSVDPDILAMIEQTIETVKKDFKGLVIGNDADNFSVGANLAFMLMAANIAAWGQIADVIRAGQHATMALKHSPFPVVASLSGMALGGGCELVLHSNAVQAHVESYPGLVEVGVGLIPAWGGCKEMLLRHMSGAKKGSGGMIGNFMAAGGAMPIMKTVFETVGLAKVGQSAEEARDMKVLREDDKISMNRVRVLADAKAKCLEMAKDYKAPESQLLYLPGSSAKMAMYMAVDGMAAAGKATPHDVVVSKVLANVLSGGDTDISEGLTEQQVLDLEFEGFMELVKTKGSLDRIEHMLNTGKPLRN